MLLASLKQQTRAPQHDRAEQSSPLPLTREQYVARLEDFYGYVVPWERRLAGCVPADDPLRLGRDKAPWLEADLAWCGYSPTRRAALPLCNDLPDTGTRAQPLGACYVLEGSTLGGTLIARHVQETLGIPPEGCRYFRSYGAEVGARWQAFRQELMRHSSPEADAAIVAAAREAFEKISAWLATRRVAVA